MQRPAQGHAGLLASDGQLTRAKCLVLCIQWGFVDYVLQAYRVNANLVHALFPEPFSRMSLGLGDSNNSFNCPNKVVPQTSVGCGSSFVLLLQGQIPAQTPHHGPGVSMVKGPKSQLFTEAGLSQASAGLGILMAAPWLSQNVLGLLSLY